MTKRLHLTAEEVLDNVFLDDDDDFDDPDEPVMEGSDDEFSDGPTWTLMITMMTMIMTRPVQHHLPHLPHATVALVLKVSIKCYMYVYIHS